MSMIRFIILLSFTASVLGGCQDTIPDEVINQFDRPQDVALVCILETTNGETEPLPLACCDDVGMGSGAPGYCGYGLEDTTLYAFVTQTTPGEVAVVDLGTNNALDMDIRIPYYSYIPVGGQPKDIAATYDGSRVYTANYETEDLSAIDYRQYHSNELSPARAIPMGGPVARLIVDTVSVDPFDPEAQANFAFVTQPTLDRVAVVALDGKQYCESCSLDDELDTCGCLIGYVKLDSSIGSLVPEDEDDTDTGTDTFEDTETEEEFDTDTSTDDQTDLGIRPWSIADSKQSIYIAGTRSNFIVELDKTALVSMALALPEVGEIDLKSVYTRHLETGEFTISKMALEPGFSLVDQPKWLYAIENESGGIIVIDLIEGEMVEVNADLRNAQDPYSIKLNGHARSLAMFKEQEDDNPSALTFDGVFAVVSTSKAGLYVIDVDDQQANNQEFYRPHMLRSASDIYDLYEDTDTTDDTDDARHVEQIQLTMGDDLQEEEDADQYAEFIFENEENTSTETQTEEEDTGSEEGDTEVTTDTEEEDTELNLDEDFTQEDEWGFRYRNDPRDWSREKWELTWEGPIGISGAAVIEYDKTVTNNEGQIVSMTLWDEGRDFCGSGLKVEQDLDNPLRKLGDQIIITYDSEAVEEKYRSECDNKFKDVTLIYQIIEVLDHDNDEVTSDSIRFTASSETLDKTPNMPTFECFGQALSYSVRASDHWILRGSSSGYLHDSWDRMQTEEGIGVCKPGSRENDGLTSRVYSGIPFANYYFSFLLQNGEKLPVEGPMITDDTDDEDEDEDEDEQEVKINFETGGGFVPLYSVVGNNVTDIEVAPDNSLLMVDQAGNSLLGFDLIYNFTATQVLN